MFSLAIQVIRLHFDLTYPSGGAGLTVKAGWHSVTIKGVGFQWKFVGLSLFCHDFRPGSVWQRIGFGLYLIALGGGGASVPTWGQSSWFYTKISSFQLESAFTCNPSPHRQLKKDIDLMHLKILLTSNWFVLRLPLRNLGKAKAASLVHLQQDEFLPLVRSLHLCTNKEIFTREVDTVINLEKYSSSLYTQIKTPILS